LSVKIPPGVDNDTQIRLSGEGSPGVQGGPAGNLYVILHVQKHEFFQRRGDDILVELEINVAQAALGDEFKIPTVDGEETLNIPAGTQSGKVFRLRGRGVPHLRRAGRGDQLIVAQVVIPKKLTDEQEALFYKLAETLGKEVIPQRDKGFLGQLKDALGDVFGA
jgi:molecular chaperone DnaJ